MVRRKTAINYLYRFVSRMTYNLSSGLSEPGLANKSKHNSNKMQENQCGIIKTSNAIYKLDHSLCICCSGLAQ